jgi:hypothetical protein
MKDCTICKKELELDKYSNDKSRQDGLDTTCKICRKKQRNERKKKRKDVEIPDEKLCSYCNKNLTSENFDKKPGSSDGLHSECKPCKKKKRLVIKNNNTDNELPKNYDKLCSGCNIIKPKDEFYNQVYSIDGIGTICIDCEKKRHKDWRTDNPEKVQVYYDKYLAYYNNRRKYDPEFKISGNIRNRVRMAITRQDSSKFNNTFELIGCSPSFLVGWLEHNFDSHMSWDNYGNYWHLDHVVPCSSFDLLVEEEQYKCFNWRNCQPMEATKNLSKNNKIQLFQITMQEVRSIYYERHVQIAGKP